MTALVERFEQLVAENERGVLRMCRAILRDEHLGADAAQEAFVRLRRRLEARDAAALDRPAAWLKRAALGTAFDLARRREMRARDGPGGRAPLEPPAPEPSPLAAAALSELRARLASAVDELPEGQRGVFLLRHEGGLALREVADLLGLSLPTVKTHFARACLRLQARLTAWQADAARKPDLR